MNRRDGKHSGMPETLETPAAEIKSTAVGTAATAETLATSPEPSTAVITTTAAVMPVTAETNTTAGTHVKPVDAITSATAELVATAKEAG